MAGNQRLLAIAMAFSLANTPSGGKPDAVGVVMRAERARLGGQATAEGTTVYDGDQLSTEAGGSLGLVVGEARVELTDESSVIVRKAAGGPNEFEAELVSGTVVLSVAAGSSAEIVASSARVRPVSDVRGVVQVRRVGPYELIVFAKRGAAQISYRGESETIAEGKSYRVLLNPADDGAATVDGAKKPAKRNKALLLIALGAAAAAGTVLLWKNTESGQKGVESPDRP